MIEQNSALLEESHLVGSKNPRRQPIQAGSVRAADMSGT
jgi:hypothetical protein